MAFTNEKKPNFLKFLSKPREVGIFCVYLCEELRYTAMSNYSKLI